MDGRGFMEVETPVLVPIAAGGTARPFATHHNALDSDLYLRIATELYLKRLIVGGMEKVYEIGRIFRNEGVDLTHNPEFTMMESYEAFADYTDVMRMVEEMVSGLASEVLGTTAIEFEGETIELAPPWPRLDLREEIMRRSGIDFLECPDIESLSAAMRSAGFDVGRQMSWGGLLDKLVSDAVEPNLVQPSFLVDYPVEMSPLAKKKRGRPELVERFEGFIAGMEVCNSFTELNDPIDQRAGWSSRRPCTPSSRTSTWTGWTRTSCWPWSTACLPPAGSASASTGSSCSSQAAAPSARSSSSPTCAPASVS